MDGVNWDAVGAIGEIVGALGVILSLAYLALSIRQNSTLLRQNTSVARDSASITSAGQGAEFTRIMALHPETAAVWATGGANHAQLDEKQRRTYDMLLVSQIIQVDVNYNLYRHDTLDAEIFGIWERILNGLIASPRFHELWNTGVIDSLTTDSMSALIREKLDQGATTPTPLPGA